MKGKLVNHINYVNDGRVYCRRINAVVDFTPGFQRVNCNNCPMFAGSAQGEGVECQWVDTRPDVYDPWVVADPKIELNDIYYHELIEKPKDKESKLIVKDAKSKKNS